MSLNSHGLNFSQKILEVAVDDLIVDRFPSATVMRENAQAITELLHDSIESFAVRTGIRTTRFADAYSASVRITIDTLAKPHLSAICRFEQLPVETALRWVKSRLLNNLKTVLTNPKSKDWLGHMERIEIETVAFGSAEIEAELAGLPQEVIEVGLYNMFLRGADIGELKYLSERFDVDIEAVIGQHEVNVICEKTLDGNAQMAFDF